MVSNMPDIRLISRSSVLMSPAILALALLSVAAAETAPLATPGLSINSPSVLPSTIVGASYTHTISASGGSGSGYTWSVVAGASALTNMGLSLSSKGTVSGIVASPGQVAFTAQVKDSAGNKATESFTIASAYALSATCTLPNAVTRQLYEASALVSGGSGSGYTWSGASGSLPAGLKLMSTGEVVGTPTTTGTYPFTVKVVDSANNQATAPCKIVVYSALTITTTYLPNADAGSDWDTAVNATGGVPPYIWTVNSVDVSSTPGAWTMLEHGYPEASTSFPVYTVAGNGSGGYGGDGGLAIRAALSDMGGLAVDLSGNLYIADETTSRVRKVTASTGIISTVAGTDNSGYNGDGIAAVRAELNSPWGVAVDSSGNLYIADSGNNRIRKVTVSTGLISTVAGTGAAGYNKDGIAATKAELFAPMAIALDSSGNLYISDSGNNRIRKVTVSTGLISTVAGNGSSGYSGDGGKAIDATLGNPTAIAVDSSKDIYFIDDNGTYIRKVTASTSDIATLAGYDSASSGNNGLALDTADNVYVSGNDSYFGEGWIAMIPTSGRALTIIGGVVFNAMGNYYLGSEGDGVPGFYAAVAQNPQGLAFDSAGNFYVADTGSNRVRRTPSPASAADLIFGDGGFYPAGTASLEVTVKDSKGATASRTYPIGIASWMTLPSNLPSSMKPASAGKNYSGYISVIGGTAPYTWTVSNLQDGFTWTNNGGSAVSISGTPVLGGQLTFYVTVTDSLGNYTAPGNSNSGGYTLTISDGTLALPAPNPSSLGAAVKGKSYSGSITASGGVPGYFWTADNSGGSPSYTWTVNGSVFSSNSGGSVNLSNGLAVTNSGGLPILTVSGTPNSTGKVTFTAKIMDSVGNTAGPVTYSITASAPATRSSQSPKRVIPEP